MKKSRILFALGLVIPVLASCGGGDGKIHVKFDLNTKLETNKVNEQVFEQPSLLVEPSVVVVGDNPDNYDIYGWYPDKTFNAKWDFDVDVADKSMTLYAKWEKKHTITYYQCVEGQTPQQIWYEQVFEGSKLVKHDELQDCYEDLGYYLNCTETGQFSDPINFDEDIFVTADMNIYLKKTDYIYLSPNALKRRFTAMPAAGGGDGSEAGYITTVEDDILKEEVAEVHFGWSKTVADPYILITNPPLDVNKSQTLEVTVRNMGPGYALSFYWVGKWHDGSWIDGKEATSFIEAHAYQFDGKNKTKDKKGQTWQYDTTESGSYKSKWMTYRLPLCQKLNNGVSTWGAADKITALRIQCHYKSEDPAKSDVNILRIKSIKGCQDEDDKKYTSETADTADIEKEKKNDSDAALKEAREGQEQNNGFIFPRNDDEITVTGGETALYKHTTNAAIYGTRHGGDVSVKFEPKNNRDEIKLKDGNMYYSTLSIAYKNFSYITKFNSIYITYIDDDKAEHTIIKNPVEIPSRTTAENTVLELDLYSEELCGTVKSVELTFTPVGIDNLIEIQNITFAKYKARRVVGENFDDIYCADFTPAGGTITHDKDSGMSKVTIASTGATLTKDIAGYDLLAYESISITYKTTNIDKFKLTLTFDDDETKDIEFTDLEKDGETNVVTEDINILGKEATANSSTTVNKLTFTFETTGEIFFKTLIYDLPKTSINMSNTNYFNSSAAIAGNNRIKNMTYVEKESAYRMNLPTGTDVSEAHFYGVDKGTSDGNKIDVANMSLAGKKYFMLVYHNETAKDKIAFRYGATSEQAPDWQNSAAEAKTEIPGTGGRTGYMDCGDEQTIKTNMKEDEWAVVRIPFDEAVVGQNPICHITSWLVSLQTNNTGNLYIRAISIR